MKVLLCFPHGDDKDFCQKRVQILARQNNIQISFLMVDSEKQTMFFIEELLDIDLIYIGIHEPMHDGMRIAQKLRENGIQADIVFFTKDKTRVFEAFDVEALHYLIPGDMNKFDEVFLKAVSRARNRTSDVVSFSCAGEQRRIPISSILYFEVKQRIITVHYEGGTFEFYSTLSKIEQRLLGRGFIRIHKSLLVAESYISNITQTDITLYNGEKLPVGRQYAGRVKEKFTSQGREVK